MSGKIAIANQKGGGVMGLFKSDNTEFTTENTILTAISNEDGSFSFADVPYGNCIVREIKAPTGFVLLDASFPVTIDKDDTLLGTMNELNGGIYQMNGLLYDGYFVKEKTVQTGFILDENAYYFAITKK